MLAGLLVAQSASAAVAVRIQLQAPDGTVIPCGGTVTGVGSVVVNMYATSTVSQAITFKAAYRGGNGSGDWYMTQRQRPPAGVETLMEQVVQDLSPRQNGVTVFFGFAQSGGANTSCTFRPSAIPSRSEGIKSMRTTPSALVSDVDFLVRDYRTSAPVPCGSDNMGGRMSASLRASAPVTGVYDLHVHVETGPVFGTGPDQDMMTPDTRWWEAGLYRVVLTPTLAQFANLTAQISPGGGPQTIHLGQQNAAAVPDVSPFEMCHFTTG
jgi:hypothetical protein